MIKYSGRWLTRGEVWFDEEPTGKVDILTYCQRTSPVIGAQCTDFFTLITELSRSPDEIYQTFSKDTRYEIRRAERDQVIYDFWVASAVNSILTRFCDYYDCFAAAKQLSLLNREYLKLLADEGALDMSVARDKDGNDIVWHAYYRNEKRVRLLHSCSLFRENTDTAYRNFVGRANRLHHWRDMLRFKQEGIHQYDLGGWYEGDSDLEKLRINQFKSEFGGIVVKNYNCVQRLTIKAHVLLAAVGWLGKMKQFLK